MEQKTKDKTPQRMYKPPQHNEEASGIRRELIRRQD